VVEPLRCCTRLCEQLPINQQVQDPRSPALLERLQHLEELRRIRKIPAEALRQRIQQATELLEERPDELADRLLSILRSDQP